MKKNIICGVIIIVAIICVFGYLIMNNVSTSDITGGSGDNTTKMLSSSKGGVMVQYLLTGYFLNQLQMIL